MGRRLLIAIAIIAVAVVIFLYRSEIPYLKDHVGFLASWPTYQTVTQLFGNPLNATLISGGSIATVGGALTIAGKLKTYLGQANSQLQAVSSIKNQTETELNALKANYTGLQAQLSETITSKGTLETQYASLQKQYSDQSTALADLQAKFSAQNDSLLALKDVEKQLLEAKIRLQELNPPNLH